MEKDGKYWKKQRLGDAIDDALEKVFGGEGFMIKHYEDDLWADTTKWAIDRPLDTPKKYGQFVIREEYIGLVEYHRDVDGYIVNYRKDTPYKDDCIELMKEIETLSGKSPMTATEYIRVSEKKQTEGNSRRRAEARQEYESGGGGIDDSEYRLRKHLGDMEGIDVGWRKEQECGGDYYIYVSVNPRSVGSLSMRKIPKHWEGYDVRIDFTD